MGLFNGLNNGLSYDGGNIGLQSNHLSGLASGLISNETPEDGTAFISVWNTRNLSAGSSNNRQVRLPLTSTGIYNFVVEWGDGSKDIIRAFNAAAVTHTYAVGGVYTLKIKGTFTDLFFTTNTDRNKILEIKQWGVFRPVTTLGAFNSCPNLILDNVRGVCNTSSFGDTLVSMFNGCTNLRKIPSFTSWDLKNSVSLATIFNGCTNFNQPLSNLNTSTITNMSQMFVSATNFNSDVNFDTSSVTGMSAMFTSATRFNQPLSGWNVSACTNMSSMFSNASAFNQYIGDWDVSKVTVMSSMFNTASAFNQNINNWNVSKVTNMGNMFQQAVAFNQPLSGWNVSACTNMSLMFQSATAFNQNINSWDVSSGITMQQMFNGATNFNQPLSGWNVSACTNMFLMFASATVFNQYIGNWNVGKVTNMANMFSSAIAFNQPLSGWVASACTNMSGMFSNASAFNGPLSGLVTSACVTMSNMFVNATTFNQDIGNWDVSSVRFMDSMFQSATAFNKDIGNWNVSACTSFTNFMLGKTPATYNQVFLDSIYSGWTRVSLISGNSITFGTVKYSSGNTQSVAGRGLLSRASQLLAISNCANNGSGLIRVTSALQTLATGNKVFITGVTGTSEANGPWIVTVIDTTNIDLQGSTFVNPYTSGGGLRTGYGWTIVDGGGG